MYEDCSLQYCSLCKVSTTCTACKVNHLEIKLTDTATSFECVPVELIPLGWGINPAKTKEVITCSVDKCENCRLDSTKCHLCSLGSYYDSGSNTCKTTDTIPDNFGYDSVTRTVKACNNNNCQDCKADYLKCSVCKSKYFTSKDYNAGVYGPLPLPLLDCYPCGTLGCESCPANPSLCSACASSHPLWIKSTTVTTQPTQGDARLCYVDTSFIPPGYGQIISETNRYEKCQVSNCDNCMNNHLQCQTCKSGFTLSLDFQCYQTGVNIIGYGLITSGPNTGKLDKCTKDRCQDCSLDHTICTKCSVTANLKLYKNAAGDCLFESEIPSTKGANLDTSLVEDCVTTNCDNCKADKTKCSLCLTNFRLYQPLNQPVQCVSSALTPQPGHGIDTANPTESLKACSSPRCLDCGANYQVCTTCLPVFYKYPASATGGLANTCVYFTEIQTGYGISDPTTKDLAVCDSKCSACLTSDNKACTTCAAGYYFYKKTPSSPTVECLDTNFASITPINGLGKPASGLELTACTASVNCKDCWADNSACLSCNPKDSANANLYFDQTVNAKCIAYGAIGTGRGVEIPQLDTTKAAIVSACTITECSDCKSDNDKCFACNSGYSLHFAAPGQEPTCVQTAPQGFGKDLTSNPSRTRPCSLKDCKTCSADF